MFLLFFFSFYLIVAFVYVFDVGDKIKLQQTDLVSSQNRVNQLSREIR